MRALVFKRYSKADQITFADVPRPALKPDEILVQVHAAGLNPIDNMIPKGTFKPFLKFQLPTAPFCSRQHVRPGHSQGISTELIKREWKKSPASFPKREMRFTPRREL